MWSGVGPLPTGAQRRVGRPSSKQAANVVGDRQFSCFWYLEQQFLGGVRACARARVVAWWPNVRGGGAWRRAEAGPLGAAEGSVDRLCSEARLCEWARRRATRPFTTGHSRVPYGKRSVEPHGGINFFDKDH